MKAFLTAVLSALALAACNTAPVAQPAQLPLQVLAASNHCQDSGAYLSVHTVASREQLAADWPALAQSLGDTALTGAALVVALGQKPTPGYRLQVPATGPFQDGQLQVELLLSQPPPGRMLAQVITHPCYLIGWSGAQASSVRAFEPDSGQAWVVNP